MDNVIITSQHNNFIKKLKCLKERKERHTTKSYLVEGLRLVKHAFTLNLAPLEIVITSSFQRAPEQAAFINQIERMQLPLTVVSDLIFEKLADTHTPQGILAVMPMPCYELDRLLNSPGARLWLLLDNIQDPGNLGTMLRSCDAAGFSGMILSKNCADIFSPKVLRSTMGSIFHTPFVYVDNLAETITHLRHCGIRVYATHLAGAHNCYTTDLTNNIAVVIGNEAAGVSEPVVQACDAMIKIPMQGEAESLNAAVAASVLMFESLRQRQQL
jgi:TrmH family RNA methyltransferase